jgi:hypothetical protein
MMRAVKRILVPVGLFAILLAGAGLACSQPNPDLLQFLQADIGFTPEQIQAIQEGQAVAKAMQSRIPDEVFLFGAIYIRATPESYLKLSTDFERMRSRPGTLAFGVFNEPPQLSDLRVFAFDEDDLKDLKDCKPGDCLIQMPASSINKLQTIDWSSPDAGQRVNQLLQQSVLDFLLAYKRDGNRSLGTYDDKKHSTDVAQQFSYMLSYTKVLPARLPDFYGYLLDYPKSKPPNVTNTFYWESVKFGLKPTLRVVHMLVWRGTDSEPIAYVLAEKQLYASHYFETALDLWFCVRPSDPRQRGFYLLAAMGSEQRGLTGVKGSIVRKTAVGRSVTNLQNALVRIKNTLETPQ